VVRSVLATAGWDGGGRSREEQDGNRGEEKMGLGFHAVCSPVSIY
jgi:hypothetical protein